MQGTGELRSAQDFPERTLTSPRSLNHQSCPHPLWLLVRASLTLLALPNPPWLSIITLSTARLTFEGHDGDLGPCPVQAPQPFRFCLAVLTEVETGCEDAEGQVGVGAQEVSHMPGTVVAGAPGGEPGDTVAAARVQIPG